MSLLRKVGRSRIVKLPDSRKQVIDRFEVRSDAGDPANLATLFLAWGTPHPKYTDCLLISQPNLEASPDQAIKQDFVRVYEQIHATNETQVGKLSTSLTPDGRLVGSAQFIQLSSATASVVVPGQTTAPDNTALLLDQQTVVDDGTLRRITRTYLQATATEAQVGGDRGGVDENRRHTLARDTIQVASALYVEGTIGSTILVGTITYALTNVQPTSNGSIRRITRTYVEATRFEIQVGRDEVGTDSNARRTIRRAFIQLASADYTRGVTGAAITVSAVTYALTDEDKSETEAVRRIRRVYVEVGNTEVQVGPDLIQTDSNSRRSLVRTFVQNASAAYVKGTIGASATSGTITFALSDESNAGSDLAIRRIRRVYVEATNAQVQVGPDSTSNDANGRHTLTRTFAQLATATYVESTLGSSTTSNGVTYGYTGESKGGDSAVRVIRKNYVEVTNAEAQVGGDEIRKDDNGRHVLTRTFVQLAAAAYVEGSVSSSVTASGSTYAYAGEGKSETRAVRTITRTYVEATTSLVQVGPDVIATIDSNSRRTLVRNFVILASASYVPGVIGASVSSGAITFGLDQENDTGSTKAIRRIRRVYVEATGSVSQVGVNEIVRDPNGRDTLSAVFIQLRSGAYSPPTPGDAFGSTGFVFNSEREGGGTGIRRIVRNYVKANSTPFQLGDARVSKADEQAFVGTAGGLIVSGTKFAKQWTVRFLVAGDVTTVNTQWNNVSETKAFGLFTGYLTDTAIERVGLAYCIIVRVYNEIPHEYRWKQRQRFTFPGKLAYSSSLGPYVSQPSTTRETSIEIRDTYQVGEVAASTLTYEPIWWAQGYVSYTRASGESGGRAYQFSGVMGSVSIGITNKLFEGALCTTVSGTIESNPAAYPTSGAKLFSSIVTRWRGNIWRKRDSYVTFP